MTEVLHFPTPDFDRLFRGDRYRFEFGVHPASFDWFRWGSKDSELLEERRSLLDGHPERHLPWSAEADPVLDELMSLLPQPTEGVEVGTGRAKARYLAGSWEPDFILLQRDLDGIFRMVGGAVCDPSGWDPGAKLGLTVEAIHVPVPGLNSELGSRIGTFLNRLPSDATWCRENWGLAAFPDRNAHPSLNRPRLRRDTRPEETWLRVEHQAFRSLPRTGGIVFLIWLTIHRLSEVLQDSSVAEAFHRQLQSMPTEMAAYKGIDCLQ